MVEKTSIQPDIPELLTLREAADILKCHPNTLRNWDRVGLLKAVRIGTREDRRYRKNDILKFISK
jgi:excisionase family DNA binding protein